MKPLKTFHPTEPKSPFYSEDFNQMIQDDFIKPLTKLGYEFLGTVSTSTENDNGAHIFHFEFDYNKPIPTDEQLSFLRGYDEGSNWDYFTHYDSLTFIINWSS